MARARIRQGPDARQRPAPEGKGPDGNAPRRETGVAPRGTTRRDRSQIAGPGLSPELSSCRAGGDRDRIFPPKPAVRRRQAPGGLLFLCFFKGKRLGMRGFFAIFAAYNVFEGLEVVKTT